MSHGIHHSHPAEPTEGIDIFVQALLDKKVQTNQRVVIDDSVVRIGTEHAHDRALELALGNRTEHNNK